MYKRFCSFWLAFVILFGVCMHDGALSVKAIIPGEDTVPADGKVYCNATLDDDFADNRIIVVLSNEASLSFCDYGTADFAEIACATVRELTTASKGKVRQKVDAVKTGDIATASTDIESVLNDIDTYNQVLCLEIEDPGKENVLTAIRALEKRDDVVYAGPDYVITSAEVAAYDANIESQWALSAINLEKAWDITTGSAAVKVGIIDSGIDGEHEDLVGRVALEDSWDFTLGTDVCILPTDPYGHGTHTAGVIGALTNNNLGVDGVCQNVSLVNLRVLNDLGTGYTSNVVLAIDFAEEHDVPILVFGASTVSNSDVALREAIESYSGLFVCPAGDYLYGNNNDVNPMYPANYSFLNTITVASSTHQNAKYVDTNYGLNSVDLFAPGSNILSCCPNGYTVSNSSRSAAAYVAAIAALMLSENPDLTAVQMKSRILENVLQVDILGPYCRTGGVVEAYKAVLNSYDPYILTLSNNVLTSMAQGVHRWFKFTAPSSGTYYFYTESDLDTIGELFDSSTGILDYNDDMGGEDEGAESNYNFYIAEDLEAGDVVYIRVTAADWDCQGSFRMRISYHS